MKIASAQINCTVGEIQRNLDEHYRMLEIAIEEGVQLISFPEMSLTGYCREEGKKWAFTKTDRRLNTLKEQSAKGNIIIVVGAPIRIKGLLHIGAFIIYPNASVRTYTKQYLHDGEELFYAASKDFNPIIKIEGERISLAICADINNVDHPHQAKKNKSTVYLPCIFYSENGMEKG